MRLAFLIERKNFYRLFGPIIERSLARGYATECWHDWGQSRRGPKGSEFPDAVLAFRHGAPVVRTYRGATHLPALLAAAPPDVMIAFRRPPEVEAGGRTRWFGLQYTLDLADLIMPSGATGFDRLGLHSAYWAEHAPDVLRISAYNRSRGTGGAPKPVDAAAVAETIRRRGTLVGIPEMDQCHWIDPAPVRCALGLEPDRPVVLYIPFPFRSNPRTFWVRHVYGGRSRPLERLAVWWTGRGEYRDHIAQGWNDRRVVEAVRAFCDANGAALVVKARAKDPVPGYLSRRADHVLYDQSYYPATILELLRISSLCVHFFSTVAYEAAYAGVPSVCVAPRGEDLGFSPAWKEWFLNLDVGGSFNFPGVVYPVGLGEFVDGFAGKRLGDYALEPAARAQYVERFVGFDDGKSADRVLDAVQSLAEMGPVMA